MGHTITRERWLLPLFEELGFGRLTAAPRALTIGDRTYAIYASWRERVPIHLVGCKVDLDRRQAGVVGAAAASPHGLLQELLNRDEHSLWGVVSNGMRLRLLRDSVKLSRQAFVEFDLESMLEGEVYFGRVAGYPATPLTEPDLWATHPALWVAASVAKQQRLARDQLRRVVPTPFAPKRDETVPKPDIPIGRRHPTPVALVPDTTA